MMEAKRNPHVRQEPDRIATRQVALGLLAVLIVGTAGVVWAAFELEFVQRAAHVQRAATGLPRPPAGPPVIGRVRQTLIGVDTTTEVVAAMDREWLNDYGWISRERGIAHIPIGVAMRIIAEQGGP